MNSVMGAVVVLKDGRVLNLIIKEAKDKLKACCEVSEYLSYLGMTDVVRLKVVDGIDA